MRTFWSLRKSFHSPTRLQPRVAPLSTSRLTRIGWRRSSTAPNAERLSGAGSRLCRCACNKPLAHAGLAQGRVSIEVRLHPMMETLGVEHCAVSRFVVVHPGESFGEASLQRRVKIGT